MLHIDHRVGRVLSFFSSRRNWDSPKLSPAGECAPLPPFLGGGAHSLAREGLGESQCRPGTMSLVGTRGLQFYNFFGISIGIKWRMIAIGKKITFYFLQNVWKCTVFFAFAFKVCKKCYYDPKKFFLEKFHYGNQKNAEFYADFKFVDAGFQKCS
jgi:hypothetical protein